jgi:hypothetical protein
VKSGNASVKYVPFCWLGQTSLHVLKKNQSVKEVANVTFRDTCVCVCVCVCVCARARLAALVYVPTPFEIVVINSRISNRSLTAVVNQICSTALYKVNFLFKYRCASLNMLQHLMLPLAGLGTSSVVTHMFNYSK